MRVIRNDRLKEYEVSDVFIIASTNTDVPTYYSKWFAKVIASGTVVVKLYHADWLMRVSVAQARGYIFYSKNYGPFLRTARDLVALNKRFIFTIGDDPIFAAKVPPLEELLRQVDELIAMHGRDSVIWKLPPLMFTSKGDLLYTEDLWRLAEQMSMRGIFRCLLEIFSTRYHPTIISNRLRDVGIESVSEFDHGNDMMMTRLSKLVMKLETFGLTIYENKEYILSDLLVSDIEDRVNAVDIGRIGMPCPTQCLYCDTNFTTNYENNGLRRKEIDMANAGLDAGLEDYYRRTGLRVLNPTAKDYSPYMVELRARIPADGTREEMIVNVVGDPSDTNHAYTGIN
jgi:hypothetical protein